MGAGVAGRGRRSSRDWGFEIEHWEGKFFFDDLLDAKVREFNPRYAEAEGALLGKFRHLHADIYGNREFVEHLRNRGKFYDPEEKREDVVFLITGIPVLVIECKNATKGEGIALGIDQIRAAIHRHGCDRVFLRGDLEHGWAEHFRMERGTTGHTEYTEGVWI